MRCLGKETERERDREREPSNLWGGGRRVADDGRCDSSRKAKVHISLRRVLRATPIPAFSGYASVFLSDKP